MFALCLYVFPFWPLRVEVFTWGHSDCGGCSDDVQEKLHSVLCVQASGGAFAALKSDGSVVTWGHPDCGGDSQAGATWDPCVGPVCVLFERTCCASMHTAYSSSWVAQVLMFHSSMRDQIRMIPTLCHHLINWQLQRLGKRKDYKEGQVDLNYPCSTSLNSFVRLWQSQVYNSEKGWFCFADVLLVLLRSSRSC